jgi:inositol polyphosphate 1-phosphatase
MLANMKSFLQAIIGVSEKAANIARACRREAQLFRLLVQEKSNEEKNQRFVQDFKTLADVLIQETVKHELGTRVRKSPKIKT